MKRRVEKVEITQTVNHKYDTPPEVVMKASELQAELVKGWVKQNAPENLLVDINLWRDEGRKCYVFSFKLNGQVHTGNIHDHSLRSRPLRETLVSVIAFAVAELMNVEMPPVG